MIKIKKFTLGLQPEDVAFRIDSLKGSLIDEILRARGSDISLDYYDGIGETGVVDLVGDKNKNYLHVDRHGIILTKHAYPLGEVDLQASVQEFLAVIKVIQKTAQFSNFRRIGFALEHRVDDAKASQKLIESVTKIHAPRFGANFMLHFESRKPTMEALAPDINKSDFYNTIIDLYDSAVDGAFPEVGKINANIDWQRYYYPSFSGKLSSEIEKLSLQLKKELEGFYAEVRRLGLVK